jgi:cephalosporin hydroxylase
LRLTVDTAARTVAIEEDGAQRTLDLYGREAFELLSSLWVKVGWNEKYTYTFSWLGRPVIQLPEDLIRAQEVIHRVRPDVVIETGVAHGGSLVFWATVLEALDRGRVIGIDLEIRPHNRAALETHPLAPRITLVEGSSIDPAVVDRVRALVRPGEIVLVFLDSNHSYAHVRSELEAYAPLVTPGSYIVATDGVAREVADTPRGSPAWVRDNPAAAAADFARVHPEFVLEQPPWPFRESGLRKPVTHWPEAWLRRRAE